ncbi:MAG: hypothetical protein U0324_31355 [Polyangiales bacterium]
MKTNLSMGGRAAWVVRAWALTLLTLGCATAGGTAPRYAVRELRSPAPAGASAARALTPPVDQVANAMQAIAPRVRACGQGRRGTVQVAVFFRRTGEVDRVSLPYGLSSTPLGDCIEGALRQARLPPFERETFSVSYPYSLR